MDRLTKNALSILVNLAFCANQLLAQLPPITFEAVEWVPYQPVGNGVQPDWQLFSGNAIVSAAGEGYGGGKALKIPASPSESRISRSVEWDPAENIAFIDFRLKPAAEPLGNSATFHVNGSQIAFQVPEDSSTGEIWVLHGHDGYSGEEPEWIKTAGTFTVPSGGTAAVDYLRVTLRHDYGRNIWDMFIDEKLAAANLGFNAKGPSLGSIDFFGSEAGATWIDDLSADPVNMLFTDTDKDGLPDAWELANGSNPNLYDRDGMNAQGKSFLDAYMDSKWSAAAVNGSSGITSPGGLANLSIDADAPHQPVGALKGALSIGADGSASYSVPIDIPKGTGGMEPKLSLGYSSNSGNGIIGVGWNLAGLQQITRGPATVAKDGEYAPVDFDSKDRFFLNGERLVCIAGTYGQPGSEYRTEIDSFARITAIGTGPASWKVETKAGLIVTLGGNAESKTSVAAGTLTWGVSEVADSVGNYYTVTYVRSDPVGDFDFVNHRVSRIDYTGNRGENEDPYCSVIFSYENRSDVIESFTALAGYRSTMRLAKIRVLTGTYVNHSYRLAYKNSYQSGRSLLEKLTKHMRDDDHLEVSPTEFTYDGLVEPANPNTNPLWNNAEISKLPVYGDGLDATGDVNSMVTIDALKTTIQLTGDVARAYRLPGTGIALQQDTRIKFEIRSPRLNSGALIGLDSDTNYQSASSTALYRICETGKTGGTIKMADGMNFAGVTKTYDPSGWTTFTLNIGADQPNSGLRKYLVLMLVDNSISDSVDTVEFRNIRIYNANSQEPTQIAPLQFDAPDQLPRYAGEEGADLGIVALDLDSDGLADLADWRAISYSRGIGNILSPITLGNTYRNTGFRSFERDTSIRPPTYLPLSVRSSDADASEYNRRHHLVAQPVDIDGDGSLDLMSSDNIVSPHGSIKNGYKFYSFANGAWTVKAGWDLPFLIANQYALSNHGGRYRDEHFQWIDLNSDGYQDLVVHTSNDGQLFSTSGALILDNNKGTAYLNKGTTGPGWILAPEYRLPEILMDEQKDLGRRVVDLNGDGVPEIAEASDIGGSPVRHTYRLGSGSGYLWNSTPGLANPPMSRYDLPTSLVTGDKKSEGVILSDLNADGMVDVYKFNSNSSSQVWMNRGGKGSTAWVREPALGGGETSASSYSMPSPLHFPLDGAMVSYGFEQADLNGDGLLDILYSDDESSSRVGPDNFALVNTGNGWRELNNWGLPGNYRIFTSNDTREKGKRRSKLQDINGDGFPDLITGVIDQTPRVWLNNCRPEVLQTVTDGFGSQLTVAYRRLNDPNPINGFNSRVYEKRSGELGEDQTAIIDSRLVVSRYSEPNGKGGYRYRSQRYGDLRYDRKNESSLGFGWIEAMDELNGQVSRTENSRDYPFAGSPIRTTSFVEVTTADLNSALPGVTAGTKLLSEETAVYKQMPYTVGAGGVIRRPVQTQSVKTLRDLKGTVVSQTTTTQNLADFDDYGFVKVSTVSSLDGSSVKAENAYNHIFTGGRWHLGRLSESTVTKTGAGKSNIVKKSKFTYDPNGLIESEIIEPDGGAAFMSTKAYQRDGFGNVTRTTVTADNISRSSSSVYDSVGRFLIAESNQLNHTVSYNYDGERAVLLHTTDIARNVTSFGYDEFGTLIRTYHPGGLLTGESTGKSNGSLLPQKVRDEVANPIVFFRAKQVSGTPTAKVYLDIFGREVVTESLVLRAFTSSQGSTYSKVYTVTQYDANGRKVKITEPFDGSATPAATYVTYDVLGRVLKTVHPDLAVDLALEFNTQILNSQPVSYSKVKNRASGILERWEDQHGRLIQSRDPSTQITKFKHDHEGRILEVSVGGETLLTNVFNLLGNKTSVWEKNSGTSTATHNALGEVTQTKNAKLQSTNYITDSSGRPWKVIKPEGTYETFYDGPDASALGMPWKTTGPNDYQEIISYDSLGRPHTTRKTQRTPGQDLETFTTATTLDALGRVLTETDAGGLMVVHEYDGNYSFPVRLRIGPGSEGAGKVLWQAGTFDSKGRPLSQTLAQGVTTSATYKPNTNHVGTLKATQADGTTLLQDKIYAWDTLGNLTSRTDSLSGRTETFGYDGLNRVTSATVSGTGGPPVANFGYNTNGNLTSKPGATLTYGGIRPHAVTAATVKNASRTYVYDDAGYVTSDGKRTYTWTSFGQLSSLDYLSAPALQNFAGTQIYAPSRVQTNFFFDAGGNRSSQLKQRIAADDSRILEETLYLGSYEREVHSTRAAGSGTYVPDRKVHRHNLGGVVYTRTKKDGLPDTVKLTTLLKDHLGSTDVLYTGTWNGSDFTNPVIEKQSFDSWGGRRDPATLASYRATDTDPFRTSAQDYDRGYTGHEQLDDSGLIHMNGRLYDPELGRMLSPDPYVQVPEYSQNFNRYSYVMNNPLNLTDPTGFSWLGDAFKSIGGWLKQNWRTVVVIVVVAIVSWGVGAALVNGGNAAIAAGGTGTSFATGTAATGATLTPTGMAVAGGVAGAVGGGLSAGLSGGSWGDVLRGAAVAGIQGAIAGGILHGWTPETAGFNYETAQHVAGHGVLGGSANYAMGGKFQDGFLSGGAGVIASYGSFASGSVASRTIKSAVVGGTVSAIGGGKFANGAWTGAFQHLLNAELGEALKARRLHYAEQLLSVAEHEIGVSENGGSSDIARIKQYHNSTGDARGSGEGTPWCSSFVNWILETTGNTGTNSAWAQGWKNWGRDAGGPVLGAIAVFKNVKGGGHVGFVAGVAPDGTLRILGGNQSDRVKYSNFNPNGSTLKIIAFRVPNISNRALIVAPVVGGQAGNESTR